MELMVVVAVVGILSAVVVPTFLGSKTTAEAGASIGEAVGLAKECALHMASGGIGQNPDPGRCVVTEGGTFAATWSPSINAALVCLGSRATSAVRQATINVDTSGGMTCTFS
jgi:type IV pilus assembly protein PilA